MKKIERIFIVIFMKNNHNNRQYYLLKKDGTFIKTRTLRESLNKIKKKKREINYRICGSK